MIELPNNLYVALGFMIVMNLGTIGSVLYASFKLVWWLSKLDSRVESNIESIVRAHERIDKLQKIGVYNESII